MKATIKICTVEKEFTQDQRDIMRRVSNVLTEHNLSVTVVIKVKKKEILNLKVV